MSPVATVGGTTGVVTPGAQGTLVITYSTGCAPAATVSVVVDSVPGTISISGALCVGGATVNATCTALGGTWSGGTAGIATIDPTSGVVTPSSTGTGGATSITYTNTCGSASYTITVNTPPGTISGTTPLCSGGSTTTLTDPVSGGTWSGTSGVGSVVAGTGVFTTGFVQGTITVSYSVPGCTLPSTFSIAVDNTPTAITGLSLLCVGGTTINAACAAAGGVWSGGTTGIATIDSTTGVITPAATGTGGTTTITYTNVCGAISTLITVNVAPTAITGDVAMCTGGSTISLADSSPGGVWSGTGGAGSVNTSTGVFTSGVLRAQLL